ncbi:MAG: ATP-binding cassette domain-containing protein [Anaerolineales bacterium]|nr:ATP-binding cassette domain-containing protein [Anaerolineales bacterium]
MDKSNQPTAVSVEGVSRMFGDLSAVDFLSLQVPPGEIFGLLGPNGAGKSTLIHMIIGILPRNAGLIQVLGLDPETDRREVRKLIGFVPQHTNVYLDLSAIENLWHHAALYCENLTDMAEKIKNQLQRMNLWERRKDPVRTFSGGMKRRLVLARALLHDPQVIFFDEPTLGVDVQGRHVLWEHIKAQQDRGKTFLITTNDMNEADRLCDRLMIIDRGKSVAVDTPEALKSDLGRDIVTIRTQPDIEAPETLFSDLGIQSISRSKNGFLRLEVLTAEEIAGELVKRVGASYQLETMRIARPTLDDVFLHHTGRELREA